MGVWIIRTSGTSPLGSIYIPEPVTEKINTNTSLNCQKIERGPTKVNREPLSDQSNIVEVRKKLSCRPCGLHGLKSCPKSHFKCAYDINVSQLLELL